jgi:hypothetical protein
MNGDVSACRSAAWLIVHGNLEEVAQPCNNWDRWRSDFLGFARDSVPYESEGYRFDSCGVYFGTCNELRRIDIEW